MGQSHAGASSTVSNPNAETLLNGGEKALPETLRWAQWLKTNATTNGDLKQDVAFNYAGSSSSTLDSFATQVQGMAKRVASFVSMMENYATEEGIEKLETMITDFAAEAGAEILEVVEDQIEG